MRKIKAELGLAAALAILQAIPASAAGNIATTPHQTSFERERSAEEWVKLRDNRIEWDELPDLVHEYNPSISALWISYRQNENNGTYNLDYNDALSSIEENFAEALGTSDIGDLQAELSYNQNLSGIDSVIQSSDRKKVTANYCRQELAAVSALRSDLIAIYTKALTTRLNQMTYDQDRLLKEAEERKLAAGTSTELSVLAADQTLKEAKVQLLSAQNAETKNRQTLLVNLGWAYNASPEICEIPEVSDEMVSSLDLGKDTAAAAENSLQLQMDERDLANAMSDSGKHQAELTLDNARESVKSQMMSKYQAVLQAKNSLDASRLSAVNADDTLQKTKRAYDTGKSSKLELSTAEYNAKTAEINEELSRYQLADAYYVYLDYRDGLAGGTN